MPRDRTQDLLAVLNDVWTADRVAVTLGLTIPTDPDAERPVVGMSWQVDRDAPRRKYGFILIFHVTALRKAGLARIRIDRGEVIDIGFIARLDDEIEGALAELAKGLGL